jgi:hypothetical protein
VPLFLRRQGDRALATLRLAQGVIVSLHCHWLPLTATNDYKVILLSLLSFPAKVTASPSAKLHPDAVQPDVAAEGWRDPRHLQSPLVW